MKRVYLTGPTPDTDPEIASVDRASIETSILAVVEAGYSVFSPYPMLTYALRQNRSTSFIRTISREWLKVADAMILLPGWEGCQDTKEDLSIASLFGVPVFDSIFELLRWEYLPDAEKMR